MTRYESAIERVAERRQGADASLTTSIAEIMTVALQELIEAELTATIEAEPGERSPSRLAQRNGHRPKLLSTPAGDVELASRNFGPGPSSRSCSRRAGRIDKALWAVIMRAYITGTSTTKSTITSRPSGATPVSRSPRCHGSAS